MERQSEHDVDALMAQTAWLRGLAASLVRDRSEADDVVQDTFVAALERPPNQVGPEHRGLRAFLATVARNVVRDRRRGAENREARERSVARREVELDGDERAERFAVQRRVVEAVAALDEPYRSAVLMRWFDGLPPRVIAERLGVPVRTVHTRLARALEKLRARLDREHGGDRRAWALVLARGLEVEAVATGGLVLLMSSKLKVAVALALVAVGAWWAWSAWGGDARAEVAAQHIDAPAKLVEDAPREHADAPRAVEQTTDARTSAIVPTPRPSGPCIAIRAVDNANAPRAGVRVVLAHSPVAGSGIPDELVRDDHSMEQSATTGADGYAYFEVPRAREFEALASIADGIPQRAEKLAAGMEHVFRFGAPATLKGRVVWADNGEPIAGALVACAYDRHRDRYGVRTDEKGEYALAGITFAPAPIYVFAPEGMPLFLNATLAEGTTVEQTFFVIRGNTVRGVVRDERTKQPLAGARIELVSAPRFTRSVTCDAEGHYAFPGLGNGGSWDLRAHAMGYGMRDGQSIGRAEDAELDFDLEPERVIRGRVVDAERRPMAGVYAAAEAAMPRFGLAGKWWTVARTREDGVFELHELDARAIHRMHLHAEGRGAKTIELAKVERERLDVDLGEIVLLAVGSVVGHVRDEAGEPLSAGLQAELVGDIDAVPYYSTAARSGLRDARTDAAGEFMLLDLAPGRYAVRVRIADRIGPMPMFVDLAAGEVRDLDVRLQSTLSIRGVVLGPDGTPLAGASVSLPRDMGSLRFGQTKTALDGTFELTGLQPGRYLVVAEQSLDGAGEPGRVPMTQAYAGEVEAGTSDLVIRVPRRIVARCRVVDSSGKPVEGVRVRVRRADGYFSGETNTDKDGRATLHGSEHTLHQLRVQAPWPSFEKVVEVVVEPQTLLELDTELDAYLEKGHELELRLPDPPH